MYTLKHQVVHPIKHCHPNGDGVLSVRLLTFALVLQLLIHTKKWYHRLEFMANAMKKKLPMHKITTEYTKTNRSGLINFLIKGQIIDAC